MGEGSFFTRIDLKAPAKGRVKPRSTGRDEAYYQERGCDVCPLVDTCGGIENSQVQPSGSSQPLVYILGEAPGKDEADQGEPFCVADTSVVLTADLRWIPISDIRVGDKLLAPDESAECIGGHSASGKGMRRWRIAEVTFVRKSRRPCLRVVTPFGDLIATGDHRVLTAYECNNKMRWMRVDHLISYPSRRSCLAYALPVWESNESYDGGWLAGFFSGEGHVTGRSKGEQGGGTSICCGFSQNGGPTCEEAKSKLASLGFDFGLNSVGGVCNEKWVIKGGFKRIVEFLGSVRPQRLITKFQRSVIERAPRVSRVIPAPVISKLEAAVPYDVVDIKTTTGTFMCNGFIVHNCGKAGQELRKHIRDLSICRFNNTVRGRPDNNRTPTMAEMESCFPAGTLVCPVGPVNKSYRRWYDGPMVTIKTASGRVLTATPNHPIFTVNGKTAIKDVHVGDYAFGAATCDDMLSRAPYQYHKPTRIDEVFESLMETSQVERVGSTPLDFHGDGVADGEINIVRANSHLGSDIQFGPYSQQKFAEPIFTYADATSGLLMQSSSLDDRFGVLTMIAAGHSISPAVGSHSDSLLLGNSANRNVMMFQQSCNGVRVDVPKAAQAVEAFPSSVTVNDSFGWESLPPCFRPASGVRTSGSLCLCSQGYAVSEQELPDGSRVCAGETLQCSEAGALLVELDQIVSVETVSDFRGHVFNLESGSHYYTAEGLMVSNCRAHLVADIERTKPEAILCCGGTALSWFLGGDPKITNWRGRRLPVKVGTHRCWMYPIMHPSFIIRNSGEKGPDKEARQHAVMFKLDIKRCFDETKKGVPLNDLPYGIDTLEEGVELATPAKGIKWLVEMLQHASKQKLVGLDIETNRVRPYGGGSRILSLAISTPKHTFAFPIGHNDAWWDAGEEITLMGALHDFLLSPVMKVVHNASFDMEWLVWKFGPKILKDELWDTWGCTQNQAYTLDERKEGGMQKLDSLCVERLGTRLKKYSDVDAARGEVAEIGKLLRYNALDAKCHRLLYEEQDRALKAAKLRETYLDHVRRVPFLVLMQYKGVPVSQPVVDELLVSTNAKIREVTRAALDTTEAHEYRNTWGTPFILNGKGSRQCLERVFGHIEALYRKDGDGEEVFTTDSSVFSTIDSPLAHSIGEYREWTKLRDTYLLPMQAGPGSLVYADGNLHANFNGTFTDTGRLSSDNPNCFPDDVETLTSRGWVHWASVTPTDYLAQYDIETKEISFARPLSLISRPHEGSLLRLWLKRSLDIISTPDHRFTVRSRHPGKNPKWVTAETLPSDCQIPRAGWFYGGTLNLRSSQVVLISALQADAEYHKAGHIIWSFSRNRKIERLDAALRDEGITFRKSLVRGGRCTTFYVARRDVPSWLSDKKQYGPWILDVTLACRQMLAAELRHWDGGFTRPGRSSEFCCGNQQDADWVQILWMLTGHRATATHRASTSPKTLFVNNAVNDHSLTTNHQKIVVPYSGTVYCATMPKGTVIVRYNGRSMIAGNCQNFPKREHAEVRRMVEAPDGWVIISADMKQLEVCVAAWRSKDKKLLKAVRDRADIHMKYAVMLSESVPLYLELVGHGDIKKARSAIKSLITFPFLYGAIHKTAARNVLALMSQFDRRRADSVSKKVASTCEVIEAEFWKEYKGVKAWQNELLAEYERTGRVTCANGRRRRGPLSINQIANAPIQGDASDLVVDAGNRLAQQGLREDNPALIMNMNIHDDLTTFAPDDKADDVISAMVETMLHPSYDHWDCKECPLGVEVSVGTNWSNQKAIGTWYSDEF